MKFFLSTGLSISWVITGEPDGRYLYLVVETMKGMREIAIKSCSLFEERRALVNNFHLFRSLFRNARKGD